MREGKSILSLFLAFMIIFTSFNFGSFVSEASSDGFIDLKGSWAEEVINDLKTRGIINDSLLGSERFHAETMITRGETVELVLKANLTNRLLESQLESINEVTSFPDIQNHELAKYIELGSSFGIINGYPDGSFKPDAMISRAEFVTILLNSQDILKTMAANKANGITFTDLKENYWAWNNIIMATKVGLIHGYPNGSFGPDNNITRAEAYKMIGNYYDICFKEYPGLVGFAMKDKGLAAGLTVKLIDEKDGSLIEEKTTNKYGQFRFESRENLGRRIEAANGEYMAILPKLDLQLGTALLDQMLILEKLVNVSGVAYKSSSRKTNKDPLTFEDKEVELKTTTDELGRFDIDLLPNRLYSVYTMINGVKTKIGQVKLGESPIANLILKPAGEEGTGYYYGGNDGYNPNPGPVTSGDHIYSITDLIANRERNKISAEVTTTEACYLDVQILSDPSGINTDWTGGRELARGRIEVAEALESEYIDLPLFPNLPERFVIVARLLDADNRELSNPFVSLDYTAAYEEFQSKTIYDFDPQYVVNLDDLTDNNFLVLKEGVRQLRAGENNRNILDASQAKQARYLFENVDEQIKSLKNGDRIAIIDSDGVNVYLLQVREIRTNQGRVIIDAESDYVMEDFISYIKIDLDKDIDTATIDMTEADEGVELLEDPNDPRYDFDIEMGYEGDGEGQNYNNIVPYVEIIDIDIDISSGIGFGLNYKDILTGKVKGTIKGSIEISYDLHLFGKDYFKSKFVMTLDAETKLTLKLEGESDNEAKLKGKELKLGRITFPVGVTGLTTSARLNLPLDWDISASGNASAKVKTESGFIYSTQGGYQSINKKDYSANINIKGSARLAIGPKTSYSIEFLEEVCRAKIEAHAGVEIEGDAVYQIVNPTTASSRHECALCVDGGIDKFAKLSFKLTYKITKHLKGTPLDITLAEYRSHLANFYISVINSVDSIHNGRVKFGLGDCPNKSYRTTFNPQNQAGNTLGEANVIVNKKVGGGQVSSGRGKYVAYLYPGDYIASATASGINFANKEFKVESSAQEVIISEHSGANGTLKGNVKDADTYDPVPSKVTVYKGSTIVKSENTSQRGIYEMSLPAGRYRVVIDAINYIKFVAYVDIEEGRTHHMETFLMIIEGQGDGIATGRITNAINNFPIEGVKLVARAGWNNSLEGSIVGTFYTDAQGLYNISLPYGNYTLTATKEGYVTDTVNIIAKSNPSTKNSTLTPLLASDTYRIVLTWGEEPRDLDSHLIADGVHVFYGAKNSPHAILDIDIVTSYGPETVTISNLAALGDFKYAIHNYTDRMERSDAYRLALSDAKVRLYKGSELIRTYNVPTNMDGTVWNVFTMDSDGQITDLNTFEYESSPGNVGRMGSSLLHGEPDQLKDYEILDISEQLEENY